MTSFQLQFLRVVAFARRGTTPSLLFSVALPFSTSRTASLWVCLLFANISIAADNLPALTVSNPATSASCIVPEAGAPSCAVQNAPGRASEKESVRHHVGNPIDVLSGNKYQYELDYKSFSSGLTLARHYNSSLSTYNVGFGQGWRHTYQVLLTRNGTDQLNVVQSDGRLIRFYRSRDGNHPDRFLSASASDGYLEFAERSIWYLPDGRRMMFQGSHLVLLDFGNHLGKLTLHYGNGKLLSVTDQHGQSLSFQYVPDSNGLPEYGNDGALKPAGAIKSVALPNGNVILYQYGPYQNLMGVQYPDGQMLDYGYHDGDWPSHLTLRQSTQENRVSEWRYDESGQAVAWVEEGGVNGLKIARDAINPDSAGAMAGGTGATVTYADGREGRYDWQYGNDAFSREDKRVGITCDNCLPQEALIVKGADDVAIAQMQVDAAETIADSVKNPAGAVTAAISPLDDALARLWAGMEHSTDDLQKSSGLSSYEGIYPHEQGDVSIKLTTDRTGRIYNVIVGSMSLSELAGRTLTEKLPQCYSGDYSDNVETFLHDRIHALGMGGELCHLDGLLAVELLQKLEAYSSPEYDLPFPLREGRTGYKESVPWWSDMTRYCEMPPGKTCSQLADDLNMALLSRCAYGVYSCEPGFRLVAPEEIGLLDDQFHLDGFDAQLYYDAMEDRYVVAFRGTDSVGDDWHTNFEQAGGRKTRQYDLALELATRIAGRLPDAEIEFTGHSLGGGLASIAALATQSQATVFNTAALQPTTARLYGVDAAYGNAHQYINHVHTNFDPVTVLQERADELDWGDMQTAPGVFTQIPNPDIPWVNAVHENARGPDGFLPIIWHSMDAVIHVLESLIRFNCS